ncbi:MAG: homoserine dehydrogenase [Acidimicrobiales bacterium]
MDSSQIRVGLLGCGHVGGALVSLLAERADDIEARTGLRLTLSKVAVRNLGKERDVDVPAGLLTHDAHSVVDDPDIDVVVELIGGIEPARGLILDALKAGKPVVTGNKELLANVGTELFEASRLSGAELAYEASVAGALPVIRLLRESLAGEHITRIMGIVNGTTNYILTRMGEESISYSEALAEAQSLGFAERDPTADVEGFDAGAKAAIIARIAFGVDVVAGDVYREGIADVTLADLDFAKRLGYVVKLLAIAERHQGGPIAVRVHPAMLDKSHPLAGVRGSFNAVFVEGDALGELMLYGRGAGGKPSASAVLGDLIDVARGVGAGPGLAVNGRQGFMAPAPARIKPMDELSSQYYINIVVADRPGVLATVAAVFGRHGVSIRSMEQADLGGEARLIFISHSALESDMQATLHELRLLDCVERIGGLLRVMGSG